MPYCLDCGNYSDNASFYCQHCGGQMQNLQSGMPRISDTMAKQHDYTGSGPSSSMDDQERFLSGFSWGPGCFIFLISKAMSIFFVFYMLLNMLEEFNKRWIDEPAGAPSELLQIQSTIGFILSLLFIVLMIWAGKAARRRRWATQHWQDFEHFRRNEKNWNTVGIIGWVFYCTCYIAVYIFHYKVPH